MKNLLKAQALHTFIEILTIITKFLRLSWQVILMLHRWGYVTFDIILIVYSNCLYKFKNAQRKSTEIPYFFFEHS